MQVRVLLKLPDNPRVLQKSIDHKGAAPVAIGTRDPRLDVFRGLGMLIILAAHIP